MSDAKQDPSDAKQDPSDAKQDPSDAKRDLHDDPRHQELIEWLKSQGHNDQAIHRILNKVAEYDNRTIAESIFDSIDSGDFDIASLIDEALADES